MVQQIYIITVLKKLKQQSGGFTVSGVCTATSLQGYGSSLSGINTDLVLTTSPQLGGTLDLNSNHISRYLETRKK